MAKIIGIVGTRSRDSQVDCDIVEKALLDVYENGDTICSGLCPSGADRFAVILAEKYNIKTMWFPAEWDKFGKSAGIVRNTDIAKNSDMLIACVADNRQGGTEDTIRKFRRFHGDGDLIILRKMNGKAHDFSRGSMSERGI